jgi:catechol 2,3-dioxygenase-like lactoylglutathione lyase family enzyme
MLADSKAFSGFAVDDLDKARQFYGETLGLEVELLDEENGLLTLHLAGDRDTLAYLSPEMTPPSYTILNFPVEDIDQAVDELSARGVSFEQYGNDEMPQDEKGVMREGGPFIAWFKDPAGNTLSVLQER